MSRESESKRGPDWQGYREASSLSKHRMSRECGSNRCGLCSAAGYVFPVHDQYREHTIQADGQKRLAISAKCGGHTTQDALEVEELRFMGPLFGQHNTPYASNHWNPAEFDVGWLSPAYSPNINSYDLMLRTNSTSSQGSYSADCKEYPVYLNFTLGLDVANGYFSF